MERQTYKRKPSGFSRDRKSNVKPKYLKHLSYRSNYTYADPNGRFDPLKLRFENISLLKSYFLTWQFEEQMREIYSPTELITITESLYNILVKYAKDRNIQLEEPTWTEHNEICDLLNWVLITFKKLSPYNFCISVADPKEACFVQGSPDYRINEAVYAFEISKICILNDLNPQLYKTALKVFKKIHEDVGVDFWDYGDQGFIMDEIIVERSFDEESILITTLSEFDEKTPMIEDVINEQMDVIGQIEELRNHYANGLPAQVLSDIHRVGNCPIDMILKEIDSFKSKDKRLNKVNTWLRSMCKILMDAKPLTDFAPGEFRYSQDIESHLDVSRYMMFAWDMTDGLWQEVEEFINVEYQDQGFAPVVHSKRITINNTKDVELSDFIYEFMMCFEAGILLFNQFNNEQLWKKKR